MLLLFRNKHRVRVSLIWESQNESKAEPVGIRCDLARFGQLDHVHGAKIGRRFSGRDGIVAIPDYQSLMLPVLKLASDGGEHRMSDVVDTLATQLNLTEAEREELLPSGKQPVFNNRVHWAKTYLAQAKLLISTRRAFFKITERGRSVLAEKVERIDAKFLRRFEEFSIFVANGRTGVTPSPDIAPLAEDKTISQSTSLQSRPSIARLPSGVVANRMTPLGGQGDVVTPEVATAGEATTTLSTPTEFTVQSGLSIFQRLYACPSQTLAAPVTREGAESLRSVTM
jgi:hypothetical protein